MRGEGRPAELDAVGYRVARPARAFGEAAGGSSFSVAHPKPARASPVAADRGPASGGTSVLAVTAHADHMERAADLVYCRPMSRECSLRCFPPDRRNVGKLTVTFLP
jgi:hypothetical protein